ncbi:MAG: fructosamine kinase family protein [Thermoleophilia bacterium]
MTGLAAAVAAAAGSQVAATAPVGGGDVSRALRVRLADGRDLFVKHRAGAPAGMYGAEAEGLAWLAGAGALRTPRVVAAVDEGPVPFIAMEWIERGAPAPDHDERLGRGLAALHLAGAPRFGLDRDNLIAVLPQPNGPAADWPEFYARRRLRPLARRAVDDGTLPASVLSDLEALEARLPDLCGPPEPPSRLHGDLWSGNAIVDAAGLPVLIDPAVYGGHREVDLAMMRLFGGFSARVFAAYDEAHPPAPGHRDRVDLYQLYPLLVHVALFGGGYVGRFRAALARYL